MFCNTEDALAGFEKRIIIRYMAKYRNQFNQMMAIFKALSDENRVRALLALRHQELCVCQIVELLDLAPSTVSKHISILRQAGLVESRKDGRWIYYRLSDTETFPEARQSLEWVCSLLADDETIQQECSRLQDILKIDPEVLCKNQCQR